MRGLPMRTGLSAADLRVLARRETRPRVAPRLYAIAHVLDGVSRAEAARLCGMDRQALRDAVVRFNAEGEQAALAGLILRGPRPEQSGLSSWTLADLCQEVEANWGKRFHPASMSRVVRRLGFWRQKARQAHPHSDAQAQAAFAKGAPARTR